MTLDEMIAVIGEERGVVVKAVHANGFSLDTSFDDVQQNLVELYIDFIHAKDDEKEARIAFKYSDGEEAIDKSRLYDQYRKYANDRLTLWNTQKKSYDESQGGMDAFFTTRRRAGFLNERTR